MATATRTSVNSDFMRSARGEMRHYRLDPPITAHTWECEEIEPCDCPSHEYVIVSAANVMFSGPETYIFPSNDAGEVTDWLELPGSLRGSLDHEAALHNAGYRDIQETL